MRISLPSRNRSHISSPNYSWTRVELTTSLVLMMTYLFTYLLIYILVLVEPTMSEQLPAEMAHALAALQQQDVNVNAAAELQPLDTMTSSDQAPVQFASPVTESHDLAAATTTAAVTVADQQWPVGVQPAPDDWPAAYGAQHALVTEPETMTCPAVQPEQQEQLAHELTDASADQTPVTAVSADVVHQQVLEPADSAAVHPQLSVQPPQPPDAVAAADDAALLQQPCPPTIGDVVTSTAPGADTEPQPTAAVAAAELQQLQQPAEPEHSEQPTPTDAADISHVESQPSPTPAVEVSVSLKFKSGLSKNIARTTIISH